MDVRPYDYGDPHPSDLANTPPANPIDDVQISEHAVDFVPNRYPELQVQDTYNPGFDHQKLEQPVRAAFWGQVISRASNAPVPTYQVLLQNGKFITATKINELDSEVFYTGESVTVLLGQDGKYVLLGPQRPKYNAIQWAILNEDMMPGQDSAGASLMEFDEGWTAHKDIKIWDPMSLNCKLGGEKVQVTLMQRQSCRYECVGSAGLQRKVTNTGTAFADRTTRSLTLGSSSVDVHNDLGFDIPASKKFWIQYNIEDQKWYVLMMEVTMVTLQDSTDWDDPNHKFTKETKSIPCLADATPATSDIVTLVTGCS